MTAVPRVLVSAPSSGHGKTAITVGLLAAYAGRGLATAAFKVGPDHTDAAYLGLAAGRAGRNLDPRLVGPRQVAPLFAYGATGADVAIVEGTMGLFDSLAGQPEADSTAAVAGALRTPVVLVVDVAAMGQSVAALVHGFRAYDEMLWLGGVILNRVASDRHEELLRDALDDIGVPVFGALRRRDLPAALPSRQHGVVPVMQGSAEAGRAVRRLGEAIGGTVDLDRLLALARSAPRLSTEPWSPAVAVGADPAAPAARRPVVAVAGTTDLRYGYPETAELLAAAGAELVTVDPLRDEVLPAGVEALVVGGALPESYAEELSANRRLCISVAELARTGRPVLAEGAGLLWLAREFDKRPMCGVLDTVGLSMDRMVVGYREATAAADSVVTGRGERVVGYKQHRGVLNPRAGQVPAWTWGDGVPEGYVWQRVHASQLILHPAGAPWMAARLVAAARAADGGTGSPASATTSSVPGGATAPGAGAATGPNGAPGSGTAAGFGGSAGSSGVPGSGGVPVGEPATEEIRTGSGAGTSAGESVPAAVAGSTSPTSPATAPVPVSPPAGTVT
ncbi:cobyrinate a,c-diamide synthase [Solwaraspora sp. WMMD1047]|uniref:cobyrinate a,c-diamide synthase n=1 Tax=Solwaraspora sp. WMMD1047 TaxID=3016102 RepID=UPI0024165479|nr:cobyrinate a,c-diamide synthase [Solwaraspora sp. WMMD1047]MDG4829095.1 cobyrinate a,c-diamide synthase [Solwaraspora sp. WMMD1047]